MSKRIRCDDTSLLDDEPLLKKQKTDESYVWFNKVPSQITNWILQQHLWSKYRLNAQPHLKITIDNVSYFYIEINPTQAKELINKSPITIKGYNIILSKEMIEIKEEKEEDENINRMEEIEEIEEIEEEEEEMNDDKLYYRIFINNLPLECSKIELNKLFSKHGTIFAVYNSKNNNYNKAYIEFENIESLVNIAMASSIGALKINNLLFDITIDTETIDYLYNNKYDTIISDLIKFNLINPIVTTVENNNNNIEIEIDGDDDDDDDDVSICDDDDESSAEMSISPNIKTDIIIINNMHNNVTCLRADNNTDYPLSFNEKLTIKKCSDNLIESDKQIKILIIELEKEKNEFEKLFKQLENFDKKEGNLEEGEDDQSKEILQLRETQIKLNEILYNSENKLIELKNKLLILENELTEINKEITIQKHFDKQQCIKHQTECDILNKTNKTHQSKCDILNKTNKNLKETIENLRLKNEGIKKDIENVKISKADATSNCVEYENHLSTLEKKLNDNKIIFDGKKMKMQNKMNIIKSNLEIEEKKHAKSKLLLKQTVDSIQENLIKINSKNKEKDDMILSLQKQLQEYQSRHPWLMTL